MNEHQGTDEWRAARLGKATGSRIADAVRKTKSGYSTSRRKYMVQLMLERITERPMSQYVSKAMETGTEREPDAIATYEFMRNVDVKLVGYVDHPSIVDCGASSDGLVGDRGLIEVKCPEEHTHFETYQFDTIDDDYMVQMQWNMACRPEREWCDFISFHPDFPPDMQLKIIRVYRDEKRIQDLEVEVAKFLKELNEEMIKTSVARGKVAA